MISIKQVSSWDSYVFIAQCFAIFLIGAVAQSANDAPWSKVSAEHGITVWSKDRHNAPLPELLAKGQIKGNLFHVMAVILDNKRAPEWIPNCLESRQLKRISSQRTLVYSVTSSPWPISDRDTVVELIRETIKPGSEYKISMHAKPDLLPPVSGYIRIPYSENYFFLQRIDDDTTAIEYGLDVDPGGMLPDWMIRSTVQNTLIDTIKALEFQVEKTKSQYSIEISELAEEPN